MSSSPTNYNLPISRHFFKVMMPGFRKRLSIPLAFSKHIIGEKSNEAVIRSPKGLWHVKIGKCKKGQFYLGEGWSKFVEEHDLNVGEFIVFEHKGNLHFEALVYDYSSCEKEFPLDVDSGSESKDGKTRMPPRVQDISRKRAKLDKSNIARVQESSKKHAKLDKSKPPRVQDISRKRAKLDKSNIARVQESSKKHAKLDKSKIDTLNTMFTHSKETVFF